MKGLPLRKITGLRLGEDTETLGHIQKTVVPSSSREERITASEQIWGKLGQWKIKGKK